MGDVGGEHLVAELLGGCLEVAVDGGPVLSQLEADLATRIKGAGDGDDAPASAAG